METHEESSTKDIFLRTIAVLGLIAVLLLGAWGIIQLAIALPGIFGQIGGGVSNVFTSTPKESLSVSAPASATSGQSFSVSWDHTGGSDTYSYTLSYACESGLSLKAPVPTGSYESVACNTPFDYVNASDNMTVIPSLTGTNSASLVITVSSTDLSTGAITTTGLATTNVTTGAAQSSTYTPPQTTASAAPTVSYRPARVRAPLYGYPQFAIVYNSTTPNGSLITVTFTVENVGTNVIPSGWMFDALLPVNGGYTFESQPQQALYPGDKIVYSLSFNNSYGYTNYSNGYNPSEYGYSSPDYYTGYAYENGNSSYTCNYYGPCDIPGYTTSYQTPSYVSPYPVGYSYGSNSYGYGSPYGTAGTVTITVDPSGLIYELNRSENTLTIPIPAY